MLCYRNESEARGQAVRDGGRVGYILGNCGKLVKIHHGVIS